MNKMRIGEVEKKYNIKLGVRPDMKLATYLKRQGLTALARLLTRGRKYKKLINNEQ